MPSPFLSLSSFRNWLIANSAAIVGQPCLSGDCPIARFLQENNYLQPSVFSDHFHFRLDPKSREFPFQIDDYPLPPWAKRFIQIIDTDPDDTELPSQLTGALCLSILSEITPEE